MTSGGHGFVADRSDRDDRRDRDDGSTDRGTGVVGTSGDRELVDWHTEEVDGTTVYELEYDRPAPEPTTRAPTFGPTSGGTVPCREQSVRLPDGERIPAIEAAFEAEGTTLRVRREDPSILARLRRFVPW
ncbi:hypothetical protein [Haloterrigena salinisoli]|uniref:hypothetical protein n=1 Tax=Haloterrigena salinisoli TaxID=3132747 RepID=UPI00387EC3A3